MPTIDGVDMAAMREQIGVLFDAIPEVKQVDRYAQSTETTNVPSAEIYLGPVLRAPEEEQLGYNAYTAAWRINVRLALPSPTAKCDAQQLYEVLVMRFHDTFDPMTLIRAIPIIQNCSFDGADFPTNPLSDGTLYAVFTLSTTFLALQPS